MVACLCELADEFTADPAASTGHENSPLPLLHCNILPGRDRKFLNECATIH